MFLQIGIHWITGNDRSFSVQFQMIHHSNHLDTEVRKAKSWGFLLSNIPNHQKPLQQGVLDLLSGDNTSAKHLFPRVFLEWLMWCMQVLPWCPESLSNSRYTLLASIHLLFVDYLVSYVKTGENKPHNLHLQLQTPLTTLLPSSAARTLLDSNGLVESPWHATGHATQLLLASNQSGHSRW